MLYEQFAANVPVLLGINKKLNCFLTKDAGLSLRDYLKQHFQADLLCLAINNYTYIQNMAGEHIQTFLDLGVPDCRLEKFPLLYQQLINQADFLKEDGMTEEELSLLHKLHTQLVSLCERLSSYKIQETLDHCDFHSNNVLIATDTQHLTTIDWGETVITHPLFSLCC
jgi:Phosphotransferase enzyme family